MTAFPDIDRIRFDGRDPHCFRTFDVLPHFVQQAARETMIDAA